jgi:hypothetical protein
MNGIVRRSRFSRSWWPAVVLVALATACSGSKGESGAAGPAGPAGLAGATTLLRTTSVDPGADCVNGGSKLDTGLDLDANGQLSDAEVELTVFVCDGADGESVAATLVPPGASCPAGGVMVTSGSGVPTYVCNGVAGARGLPGQNGQDGQSVTVSPETAGPNCEFGGQKLQVGAGTPSYVCDGAPGAAGRDGQSVAMTPEAAGTHCQFGGQKLQVGTGAAAYVCNGAPGADGVSVTMVPEAPGAHCEFGGVGLRVGSGSTTYVCSAAMPGVTRPAVDTLDVLAVRYADAIVRADVTSDGNELVLVRGVALATHAAPTLQDDVRFAASGSGSFDVECAGLAPATTYHVRAFATNALGTSYGDELAFTTLPLTVPTLSTAAVSNVTNATAISGGSIVDDGGSAILARGICWSTAAGPTLTDSCAGEGAGTGSFIAMMTGLGGSTTYHVRSYATNAQGTSYGEDRSFATVALQLASVTTGAPSGVSYTTAVLGGNVTGDNGAAVTSRGICWSTTPAPTTSDAKYSEAGGLGPFTATIAGLSSSTTYYARAFAVNGGGTSYGNEVTFTTLAPSTPSLTTKPVGGVSSFIAGSGGVITTDGGSPITSKGVCWSLNPNPTIANSKTSDGSGPSSYNSTLTALAPLTTYYVRAYATNGLGTAYGNELSFTTTDLVSPGPTVPIVGTSPSAMTGSSTASSGGYVSSDGGSAVTARGVCWSTNASPTLADTCSSDGGAGVGFFSSTVTGLSGCGVVYYVRAYATNSTGTGYGNQTTVSTGLLPSLSTAAVADVGFYGATSGGTITDAGGCAITQKGVVWSWNPNPTVSNPRTTEGAGDAPFTSSIAPLYANRTYYVRAYATSSVGTAYGQQEVFTTATPPTPYVGQNHAGGIVFHLDGTGEHGLVVTPADIARTPWGCSGTSIPTSADVGSGATNTAAIIASCGDASTAAKVADDLVLNGYDDWFLPSRDELALIGQNLHAQALGGLTYAYWSSTQRDATRAWAFDSWGAGYLIDFSKTGRYSVRAVRAF